MKYRPAYIVKMLLALLLAGLCGCALKTAEEPVAPVQETPVPVIIVQTPTPTPAPTPVPTPEPAKKPLEYRDEIKGLSVSEILFSAKVSHVNGKAIGFIELKNSGSSEVSLAGFYLTDRFDQPEKYALPELTLAPGAYLALPMKGQDDTDKTALPFALSEKDNGLFLYYAPDKLAVRYLFSEFPDKDVSVEPQKDGSFLLCAYPTPGKKNSSVYKTAQERELALLKNVYISEVFAKDAGWMELTNGSGSAVSLQGWSWTDDPDVPGKEPLSGRIDAHGQAVFRPEKMRLSVGGETLYLYDADGFLRDCFQTGALPGGISSGRDDSAERVFYEVPTEGKPNHDGKPAAITPDPIFSERWLFREGPFTLTLSCSRSDAVIYYTTDGKRPTVKSMQYTGPIEIKKNTTVRAFAQSPGRNRSDEVSAHFILGVTHSLPVVCIDMDADLFKRLTNVPYDESGLKEQACYVTYYEADGRSGISFPAGIKPRGNASISYPQKSLSLHLRKKYGQKNVRFDFWNSGCEGPYDALVLRNSGQDTNSCHLRDAFAQTASRNLRMDTQLTKPVVVYVNGGYYGVLDLNENMNKATFMLRYGVDEKNINIVQRNSHVTLGSADGFVALRKYAMTKNFKDDAVLAKYAEKLDLGAVNDYLIAQSFFGNYDIHNQNYWSSADGTVTWRPFLYDVDRCLNAESMRSNVLAMYFNKAGIVHDRRGDRIWMDMYCALKDNKAWRTSFLNRYAYLLCNDLSTETLLSLFDEMAAAIRPEMERHTKKFGTPSSLKEWEKNVKAMRKNIASRESVITKHICAVFKLSAAEWKAIIAPYKAGAAWEETLPAAKQAS